jgi:hypothetical protein
MWATRQNQETTKAGKIFKKNWTDNVLLATKPPATKEQDYPTKRYRP